MPFQEPAENEEESVPVAKCPCPPTLGRSQFSGSNDAITNCDVQLHLGHGRQLAELFLHNIQTIQTAAAVHALSLFCCKSFRRNKRLVYCSTRIRLTASFDLLLLKAKIAQCNILAWYCICSVYIHDCNHCPSGPTYLPPSHTTRMLHNAGTIRHR